MRIKLLCASMLTIAAAPVTAQDSTWTWQQNIPAGQMIRITGIIGDISATPASGSQAEVVAKISGPAAGPRAVEIQVVEHTDGVTICAVYEDTNDCEPSGRSNSNGSRNDKVDFEVRVPRGVEFRARSVMGDIRASGLTADVSASSVSGDVSVETSALAEANSVSGSVHIKMGRSDWVGTLSVRSVSGRITIEMPDDLNTDVAFSTVSGDIDSDWPITRKNSGRRSRLNGTIGSGGRKLSLSTVSGDVELRKSE